MEILKWFKNPIWLPSPGPRTGCGCHGRCRGCHGLHPRLPWTLAPGPGYHPRLPDTSPGSRTASTAAPDTSPGPRTASKLPQTLAPGPGHHPRLPRTLSMAIGNTSPGWAQDIFQGLSSWTFMCIYTVCCYCLCCVHHCHLHQPDFY